MSLFLHFVCNDDRAECGHRRGNWIPYELSYRHNHVFWFPCGSPEMSCALAQNTTLQNLRLTIHNYRVSAFIYKSLCPTQNLPRISSKFNAQSRKAFLSRIKRSTDSLLQRDKSGVSLCRTSLRGDCDYVLVQNQDHNRYLQNGFWKN